MDHTAERIAQAAHIIGRIPSQQQRERIMQQLEHEAERAAMDRLLEQWREGLMS